MGPDTILSSCSRLTAIRKDRTDAEVGADRAAMPAAKPWPTAPVGCEPCLRDLVYRADRLSVADAPKDFRRSLPGKVVYEWRGRRLVRKINFALLLQAREAAGREARQSAGS